MKAKEKAIELYSKMDVIHYIKLGGKNSDSKGLPISMYDTQIKQCALIAVDEIINYLLDSDWALINNKAKYWQEVKEELLKL
jgi:hypothetical protein